MNILLIISFLVLSVNSFGQLNRSYSTSIDSMANEDQKYCGIVRQVENKEIKLNYKNALDARQDCFDRNYVLAKTLFDKYGYPDYKKVGNLSSFNFWLIVQHMDDHREFQKQVLDSMTIRLRDNTISKENWAYLTDRVKINYNEEQIYGTQMKLNADSSSYIPKPTINMKEINQRRKSVGLTSIEEYIDVMNKRYYGNLKKKK